VGGKEGGGEEKALDRQFPTDGVFHLGRNSEKRKAGGGHIAEMGAKIKANTCRDERGNECGEGGSQEKMKQQSPNSKKAKVKCTTL